VIYSTINGSYGYSPFAVIAADIDGDDHLDIVTTNTGNTDSVSILAGTGSGTFTTPAEGYPIVGTNPYDVIASDFDADGRLDLAVGYNSYSQVSVLFNQAIKGVVYDGDPADGGVPVSGAKVSVSINGADVLLTGEHSSTTDSLGRFSIAALVSSGDILTIYLDTDGGAQGATVTYTDAINMSDLDVYQDYLIVRSETGTQITNITLETADGDATPDSDVTDVFAVEDATNDLTTGTDTVIYVWNGDSYRPDSSNSGNVTAGGIHVAGTSSATYFYGDGNAISLTGDLEINVNSYAYVGGTPTWIIGGDMINNQYFSIENATVEIGGNWVNNNQFVRSGTSTVDFTADAGTQTI